MQAVILAGGKGTRLATRLGGRPKPLIDVGGRPLLARQLEKLHSYGVTEALLLVNHAADQIVAFLDMYDPPFPVRLIDDGEPRGTAGATLGCRDALQERFAVVYGDTLFEIDFENMLAAHLAAGADATLLLHPNDHPFDSDLVEIDGRGYITAFHPYPHPTEASLRNLVNAAFYIVEKKALDTVEHHDGVVDFAKDLFPNLLRSGARLFGYKSYEYIKDLGTPERLDRVEQDLVSGRVALSRRSVRQRAVFVDRDGTLNAIERGEYVSRPGQLALIPGAGAAVRALNAEAIRVVVITNQPILARGECDEATMDQIMASLEWQLGREKAFVDAIYLCPHHPDRGFAGEVASLKIDCACRKPRDGLVRQAIADLNIAVDESWIVGDSTADILLANRCSLASILVRTGEAGRDGKHGGHPDFTVDDIAQAARLIVEIFPTLLRHVEPLLKNVGSGDVVLVGGPARSGKSSTAAALRIALRRRGLSARTIALDRWIRSKNMRTGEFLQRFQFAQAAETLAPWLDGDSMIAKLPHYDRYRQAQSFGFELAIDNEDILILEGVPALLLSLETQRRIHRIHVTCDEAARSVRVMEDIADRYSLGEAEARQDSEARSIEEGDSALRSRYRMPFHEFHSDPAFAATA